MTERTQTMATQHAKHPNIIRGHQSHYVAQLRAVNFMFAGKQATGVHSADHGLVPGCVQKKLHSWPFSRQHQPCHVTQPSLAAPAAP